MATLIQLKRGTAQAWKKLNIVLAIGEPGFEKDTNRLKIGDGITPWNDLPYQDQNNPEIYNAETLNDFPTVGNPNIIYKASQTAKLYQWNSEYDFYEELNIGGSSGPGDFDDIKVINGGNANGTT